VPHNPNERLVLFSDAVVAITITLLVLEIRLPEGTADLPDPALWQALRAAWPQFLGYLISFAVIGAFWMGHQQRFAQITGTSRRLVLANLLFLCAIGTVPFVTGLLAENPGVLATQVYAAVMTLCALGLLGISAVAVWSGLIDPRIPRRQIRRSLLIGVADVGVFLLSIPLAIVNADGAKFFWLLLVPLAILQRPRDRTLDHAA
jgi:uncharacterized membrane protein